MLRIEKGRVYDSSNRIIGVVRDDHFTQDSHLVDPIYKKGLRPIELEQISEAMQSKVYR